MATARQIKILTVDDHPILREGIASIIQGEKDMVVVGEASTGVRPSKCSAANDRMSL